MSGSLQGRHILIVEDEYILARQLAKALANAGAIVVGPVSGVAKALAVVAAEHIDVAILDVNLAGETVYPVAEELQRRAVPFIFASGYDADERDRRFAGARHLVKPLMMPMLLSAIASTIAG